MDDANRHGITTHPDSALLEYLEDLLPREDRTVVEEHVKKCARCARELEELDRVTSMLRQEKETFCPEPWQLYEFSRSGADPNGRMTRHLESCSMCREEVESLKSECIEETTMPAAMKEAVRRKFSRIETSGESESRSISSRLSDALSSLFRIPVMAVGTAAAAILLVVLVMPRGEAGPVVGLSSIAWDQAGQGVNLFGRLNGLPKRLTPSVTVGEKKLPKVAAILLFKGFDGAVSQDKVDTLYAGMQPTDDMTRRFDFVSPSRVKDALGGTDKGPVGAKTAVEKLRSDLKVSRALLITLVSEGDTIRIEDELVDAASGKTLGKVSFYGLKEAEVPDKIKEASIALLEAKGASAD